MTKRTVATIESMGYTQWPHDYSLSVPSLWGTPYVQRVWISAQRSHVAVGSPSATGGSIVDTESIGALEKRNKPLYDWLVAQSALPAKATPYVLTEGGTEIRNNDGRTSCVRCGASTRTILLFFSHAQVCTKCGF